MTVLDAALWATSSLGTVGPTGFMVAARDSRPHLYSPLREADLTAPSMDSSMAARITVTHGRAAIADLPRPASWTPVLDSGEPVVPDRRWIGIQATRASAPPLAFAITRPWRPDHRLAEISFLAADVSLPTAEERDLLTAWWSTTKHALTQAGNVGMVGTTDGDLARHARQYEGFKPFAQVLIDYGIRF